jgi:hypothetical protein
MSVWRKKAIELLPGLKPEFNRADLTIYDVFIYLLPATVQAHKQNDKVLLKQYYDFAAWCFRQKEKDLWNAAGVAFYEHLGGFSETFNEMHLWIDKQVYNQIKGLLELRLPKEKLSSLDKRYARG